MHAKIKTLTKDQKNKLKIYRDKWNKNGLSTEPIDLKKATPLIDKFYTEILNKKKVPVILVDNPLEACNKIKDKNQVQDQVYNQIWDQIAFQVRSQKQLND